MFLDPHKTNQPIFEFLIEFDVGDTLENVKKKN